MTFGEKFWEDIEASTKVLQELTYLRDKVRAFSDLVAGFEDIETLWSLGMELDDESMEKEILHLHSAWLIALEALEIEVLFAGDYDDRSAIISLHAGTGGTEAQDWVDMLYRMYIRFCEREGFKIVNLDYQAGDEAGTKSVTFEVNGIHAYGMLKSERGVHRLVRISPFDSSGRRHTSFASVEVIPQVEQDNEIEIAPDELRLDRYRSGGAGGQHVNTTDSAVRITHIPTGIVVQCQDERSQHANYDKAMVVLRGRLLEKRILEQERELLAIRGEQQEIGWGSQIRSYVFQPYRMVKDHRTNVEIGNTDAVMDGAIMPFITGYLQYLLNFK